VPVPSGFAVVQTPTAADLERETRRRAGGADVVLMAAAVADYRPDETQQGKRAKGEDWNLALRPTVDILRLLGEEDRNGRVLVGFGAEVGAAGRKRKAAMLESKNLDLVVYNDVAQPGIGFDATDNEVVLISKKGERTVPKAPKPVIATAVLDEVERLLEERHGGP